MKKTLILITLVCLIFNTTALALNTRETVVVFDINENYLQLMLDAAKAGDLIAGEIYEQQRNFKIESLNLDLSQTNFFSTYNEPEKIVNAISDYIRPPLYSKEDAIMLAKVIFSEGRGIASLTEQACIVWTILNRFDAGYADSINAIVTAPNQFAYKAKTPVIDDYGRSLIALAEDVLERWEREKYGEANVGRVLPKDYFWYNGDGKHNIFRNKYRNGTAWNYSLPTPYES